METWAALLNRCQLAYPVGAMPPLSRWFIKLGLVYLLAGLFILAGSAGRNALGLGPWSTALFPMGVHLLTVGWLTHLIMGVAHWMFPKTTREAPRGREALVGGALVGLSGGIALRSVAEPMLSVAPGPVWGWLLLASSLLQLVAAGLFVANTWPRVRGTRGASGA